MAYIPSRIKAHYGVQGNPKLQLTSMMDMFTIILVFLLKTYSAEGNLLHPSEYLTLPTSNIEVPVEVALDVAVSKEWVMVNEKAVIKVAEMMKSNRLLVDPLQSVLKTFSTEAKKMEELYGAPFSGKVTIQGDKDLPYSVLMKVMATCASSDYPNMRLVVYRQD